MDLFTMWHRYWQVYEWVATTSLRRLVGEYVFEVFHCWQTDSNPDCRSSKASLMRMRRGLLHEMRGRSRFWRPRLICFCLDVVCNVKRLSVVTLTYFAGFLRLTRSPLCRWSPIFPYWSQCVTFVARTEVELALFQFPLKAGVLKAVVIDGIDGKEEKCFPS